MSGSLRYQRIQINCNSQSLYKISWAHCDSSLKVSAPFWINPPLPTLCYIVLIERRNHLMIKNFYRPNCQQSISMCCLVNWTWDLWWVRGAYQRFPVLQKWNSMMNRWGQSRPSASTCYLRSILTTCKEICKPLPLKSIAMGERAVYRCGFLRLLSQWAAKEIYMNTELEGWKLELYGSQHFTLAGLKGLSLPV